MESLSDLTGNPYAGDPAFPLPKDSARQTARQRPAASPEHGIELTPKGERYVAEHEPRVGAVPRLKIERAIDRHLTRVQLLIALLDDADGDPNLEPSLGGHASYSGEEDLELDDSDREPSLGSLLPSAGGFIEPLGFWRVKPYWVSEEEWAADLRRHDRVEVIPVRDDWSQTGGEDLEEEHDGAEPENEDGASWAEDQPEGVLSAFGGEHDEPDLGFPESVNQVTRSIETSTWHERDGEADYFVELPFGRVRTFEANEEDQFFGSRVLPNGQIISDREATECGRYNVAGGGYDDNGIGDDGGRQEAWGVA